VVAPEDLIEATDGDAPLNRQKQISLLKAPSLRMRRFETEKG
jgi:hypothetical protein